MQGLPDNHFLCGDPPKQFEQVGNAVCARLAMNLGKALCMAVMDGAPKSPVVEVEPEPPEDDPDAIAAGFTDAVDGDEDAVGDEVDKDDETASQESVAGRRRKAKATASTATSTAKQSKATRKKRRMV